MRSARFAILSAALILVLLPIVALFVAWTYERVLMLRFESALAELADQAAQAEDLSRVAESGRVELFRLSATGEVLEHAGTHERALRPSSMAAATRAFTELFGEPAERDPWSRLDAEAGPIAQREEVLRALGGAREFRVREARSADAVLFSFAAPHPDGGAVYVQTATLRGLRRLVGLRSELVKLALYQLAAAGVFALLLGRWLVKPLERLADGAARYPVTAIADASLLRRPDEVGTLARSFDDLARSLEERRRATVELAADMAHELKNPLATIAASAELFGSARELTPEKRQLVETQITGAVERLRAATDELLALVRLEATLPELPREDVDYLALIEEVAAEYRQHPKHGAFELSVQIAPDARQVRVVSAAWKRLLRNLLDNAVVQPMDERRIDVIVTARPTAIVTEVRDRGPGVSAGNRDKIFRRFFTQRPPDVPPGTGLGLSIVQTVARAHGGDVELVDTEGPGATFRVTLPR